MGVFHAILTGVLMSRRLDRTNRPDGLLAVMLMLAALPSRAEVNYWTKTNSGNWEESAWSLGVLPNSTQSVAIINSGFKAVAINPATSANYPESLTVNDFTIGGFNGENTLLLNFAGTAVPLRILNGLTVNGGGRILNLNAGLIVEGGSAGITNAQIIQDGGFVRTTNAPMYLRNAAYYLTNGVFEAGTVTLGMESYSTFNQYGGT